MKFTLAVLLGVVAFAAATDFHNADLEHAEESKNVHDLHDLENVEHLDSRKREWKVIN